MSARRLQIRYDETRSREQLPGMKLHLRAVFQPVELHRPLKMACDLEMATWMRKLLEINVAWLEILLSRRSPGVGYLGDVALGCVAPGLDVTVAFTAQPLTLQHVSSLNAVFTLLHFLGCPRATTLRIRICRVETWK